MIQFAQNIESQEYNLVALNNGEYGIHDHLKFNETHPKLLHGKMVIWATLVTFIHLFTIAFFKCYNYPLSI